MGVGVAVGVGDVVDLGVGVGVGVGDAVDVVVGVGVGVGVISGHFVILTAFNKITFILKRFKFRLIFMTSFSGVSIKINLIPL